MEYGYTEQELERKRQTLLEENNIIRAEIEELKEYTEECDRISKLYGIAKPRGSYFGRMRNLPDFKEKWRDTTFWLYHTDIDIYHFITLDKVDKAISEARNFVQQPLLFPGPIQLLAYCEMALPISQGFRLHLVDPFGERDITTHTISTDIMKYVGKLIHFTCTVKPNTNELQAINMKRLPYSLTKKIN